MNRDNGVRQEMKARITLFLFVLQKVIILPGTNSQQLAGLPFSLLFTRTCNIITIIIMQCLIFSHATT